MPRGQQTKLLFYDNDNYVKLPCGFYIQGRAKILNIKLKLHKKKCDNCRAKKNIKLDDDHFNKFITKKKMAISKVKNPALRACDRSEGEKSF